jgi:hypothetical protein
LFRHLLYFDGNARTTLDFPVTPGFGYTADQWRYLMVRLGGLNQGIHELRLAPASAGQVINLDLFYISDGELVFDEFEANKEDR